MPPLLTSTAPPGYCEHYLSPVWTLAEPLIRPTWVPNSSVLHERPGWPEWRVGRDAILSDRNVHSGLMASCTAPHRAKREGPPRLCSSRSRSVARRSAGFCSALLSPPAGLFLDRARPDLLDSFWSPPPPEREVRFHWVAAGSGSSAEERLDLSVLLLLLLLLLSHITCKHLGII